MCFTQLGESARIKRGRLACALSASEAVNLPTHEALAPTGMPACSSDWLGPLRLESCFHP